MKIGDKVIVKLDGKEYQGEIYVIDKNGTFKNPKIPSYDIMIPELNLLYKHVSEYDCRRC